MRAAGAPVSALAHACIRSGWPAPPPMPQSGYPQQGGWQPQQPAPSRRARSARPDGRRPTRQAGTGRRNGAPRRSCPGPLRTAAARLVPGPSAQGRPGAMRYWDGNGWTSHESAPNVAPEQRKPLPGPLRPPASIESPSWRDPDLGAQGRVRRFSRAAIVSPSWLAPIVLTSRSAPLRGTSRQPKERSAPVTPGGASARMGQAAPGTCAKGPVIAPGRRVPSPGSVTPTQTPTRDGTRDRRRRRSSAKRSA